MEFGEILKELRNDINLTQKELAEKLNISSAMISNYENKINIPRDFKILIDIANFFQVSVDKLIGNTIIIKEELTQEETSLVQMFRNLPHDDKKEILKYIKFRIQENEENKKLSISQENEKKEA